MADTKGAKTKLNSASKSSPTKKSSTTPDKLNAENNNAKERDSPEIKKDDGVENMDKDMHDSKDKETKIEVLDQNDIDNEDKANEEEKNNNETVTEADIEAAGSGKFVDEAMEEQRLKEREAFQNLIDENVKTERELKKSKDDLIILTEERDNLVGEVEKEKEANAELKEKISIMEKQVQDAEDRSKIAEADARAARGQDDQELDSTPTTQDSVSLERRLHITQLRLKRLVKDGKEKEEDMRQLQSNVSDLEDLVESLKEHVTDKEKIEEVLEEHRKRKEEKENPDDGSQKDEDIIAMQRPISKHKESKICVIQ